MSEKKRFEKFFESEVTSLEYAIHVARVLRVPEDKEMIDVLQIALNDAWYEGYWTAKRGEK